MQRAVLICAFMISALVTTPFDGAVRAATKRFALIVTNQAYLPEVGRLDNPHVDGQLVGDALRRVGFDVTIVKDAGKAGFRAAVADYITKLATAGRDAVGFFYYSGHGAAQAKYGDNYLIPVDAKLTHSAQLAFLAVKLGEVIEALAQTDAKTNFIVIDACRNTPFSAGSKSAHKGFVPERERGGVLIAYATEPGNVAVDENYYARALARQITVPGQPAVLMFRAVRRDVLRATNNSQFPWTRDGLVEEFYFAGTDPGRRPLRPAVPRAGDTIRDCDDCPELVVVPGGTFKMGARPGEAGAMPNEGPLHSATVAPFAIGRHEVTFAEWDACIAAGGCRKHRPDDRGWGRGRRPVINVSWNDAQRYLAWLGKQTGKRYRLATETEWEYAARAGTTTPFWWGGSISTDQANYDGTYTYNGKPGLYRRKTVEVSSFKANDFDLFNVHGNVAEWTASCYRKLYRPGFEADQLDDACVFRVVRGGSWYDEPAELRAARRQSLKSRARAGHIGFRVARDVDRTVK